MGTLKAAVWIQFDLYMSKHAFCCKGTFSLPNFWNFDFEGLNYYSYVFLRLHSLWESFESRQGSVNWYFTRLFLNSEFSERACFPRFGQFLLRKTTFKFMWQFIFLLILKWYPQKTVGQVDFFWTWFDKSWPGLHKHQSDWVLLGKTWTLFGIKLHRGSSSYQVWIFPSICVEKCDLFMKKIRKFCSASSKKSFSETVKWALFSKYWVESSISKGSSKGQRLSVAHLCPLDDVSRT